MRFEFATANRIIFGPGTLKEIPATAITFGRRAMVVTGSNAGRAATLLADLEEAGIQTSLYQVLGEPTTAVVLEGSQQARLAACDLVIGIGGGSVLDASKAIAALVTNAGDPLDYLEVIGAGKSLANPAAPTIAIPTTAGTGAEVTRNAVLASPEHQVKVSLRSPFMLPKVALVDPELTYSLPPGITASTGLDALTQVMEPFVTHLANPLSDAVSREGLWRAGRSLRRAYENGNDALARNDMALASLCGGLALANAKLGAVHGFAGPIGGMSSAPHGVICARLLPYVMASNVQALRSRSPESEALARYDEVAQLLTGRTTAQAEDGVAWVTELCEALVIPPLSEYGLTHDDIPPIVAKSINASSMKGNPIKLTEQELCDIMAQAI